jgi:hypothetical protein
MSIPGMTVWHRLRDFLRGDSHGYCALYICALEQQVEELTEDRVKLLAIATLVKSPRRTSEEVIAVIRHIVGQ